MLSALKLAAGVAVSIAVLLTTCPFHLLAQPAADRAQIRVSTRQVLRTFDPSRQLGADIDGHDEGELDRRLTPANIAQMLGAGLGPISYRLRTELGGEAWHWNPSGSWSDPSKQQGYWTSSSETAGEGISLCYGYALPRRGNTVDQANNDGYSRIDDGDLATFWKSNPYLDENFTHETNALHPQWVIIDLERAVPISAIKIAWGDQFATSFQVEYSTQRPTADFGLRAVGGWKGFPFGRIAQKVPKKGVFVLAKKPVLARYVRIWLTEAAHNGERSGDIRDNIGFAIREIFVGRSTRAGPFTDVVVHGRSNRGQSSIFVSSTDPWHRALDIDKNEEHIGFDRLVRTGLTRGQPIMVPVGVLYDTPENAAAEIKYLISRGIKFDRVELGEEPDGQNVSPPDYAALYLQFARAVHAVAPDAVLGGPSFQDIVAYLGEPEEGARKGRWLRTVLQYLAERGHKQDFGFMSFEWYPYDDVCAPRAPQVADSADYMRRAIEAMWEDGLDRKLPLVISEYGYSPFATSAEDDLEGAIVNLDGVGTFATMGGDVAYLYGYEPDDVEREIPCTAGNNMLFLTMPNGTLKPTSTFHAASIMTKEWLQPSGGGHDLLSSTSTDTRVGVYVVRRPDGKLSLLLINRNPNRKVSAGIEIDSASAPREVEEIQFSSEQYRWDTTLNQPTKSDPPARSNTDLSRPIELPPYSITVLRDR